jgi:hypothetical protein
MALWSTSILLVGRFVRISSRVNPLNIRERVFGLAAAETADKAVDKAADDTYLEITGS